MDCPKCGGKTKVLDSRDSDQLDVCRWRRRKCLDCGKSFTTYEILSTVLLDAKITKDKLNKIKKILGMKGEMEE